MPACNSLNLKSSIFITAWSQFFSERHFQQETQTQSNCNKAGRRARGLSRDSLSCVTTDKTRTVTSGSTTHTFVSTRCSSMMRGTYTYLSHYTVAGTPFTALGGCSFSRTWLRSIKRSPLYPLLHPEYVTAQNINSLHELKSQLRL